MLGKGLGDTIKSASSDSLTIIYLPVYLSIYFGHWKYFKIIFQNIPIRITLQRGHIKEHCLGGCLKWTCHIQQSNSRFRCLNLEIPKLRHTNKEKKSQIFKKQNSPGHWFSDEWRCGKIVAETLSGYWPYHLLLTLAKLLNLFWPQSSKLSDGTWQHNSTGIRGYCGDLMR